MRGAGPRLKSSNRGPNGGVARDTENERTRETAPTEAIGSILLGGLKGKTLVQVFRSRKVNMMASYSTAWIGICLGCVAGAIQGLFFHGEAWLGGYNSWPRRMLRLAHISLVAIGFINLAFALTVTVLGISEGVVWPSRLLIFGAITMPLVCYLSAFRDSFRHLFFIPALSVITATAMTVWRVLTQ